MKRKRGNTNSFLGNPFLRFFAGVYLLYTAYRLVQLYRDGQVPGGSGVFCLLAALGFAAFGAWLCVVSYRAYRAPGERAEAEDGDGAPPDAPLEVAEPACAGGGGDLSYALEHIGACVLEHRDVLRHFSREGYAGSFARYQAACRTVFLRADRAAEELGAAPVAEALCHALLDALDAQYAAVPRDLRRRELRERDKELLAFYLVPAVRELALSISGDFVRLLPELWCARFPGSEFHPGEYRAILEGFSRQGRGLAGG